MPTKTFKVLKSQNAEHVSLNFFEPTPTINSHQLRDKLCINGQLNVDAIKLFSYFAANAKAK